MFLKAGVAPDGRVRGERTTVFHSDLDPDKHMRATASGVIGGILGTGRVFVSGGTEHQAPPGGGVVRVYRRRGKPEWPIALLPPGPMPAWARSD